MTQIHWTKCSERMPPYNNEFYILLYDGYHVKLSGIEFRKFGGNTGDLWTPYTPETWKELNR